MKTKKCLTLAGLLVVTSINCNALIILENENNQKPPQETFPLWDNIVHFNGASGVYLGEGWIITANHVGTPSQVNINNQTKTTVANSTLVIPNYDLRIFQIQNHETISLPSVSLQSGWRYNPLTGGAPDSGNHTIASGFGVGKGSVTTGGWNWNNTKTQRWGLMETVNHPTSKTNTHYFHRTLGPDSAAATLGDSGGGVFSLNNPNDPSNPLSWSLTGILSHVSDNGKSLYDRNPFSTGDQPGYSLSQRITGLPAAHILQHTGLFTGNTASSFQPDVFTGNPLLSDRIILLENATLSQSLAPLIEVSQTPTIQTPEIGTLILKENSNATIEGQTNIQSLLGANNTNLTFANSNAQVEELGNTQSTNLALNNSTLLNQGIWQSNSLTLNNSQLLDTNQSSTNFLTLSGNSQMISADPMFITPLSGGEGSWTFFGMTVHNSIEVLEGATLRQNNIRWNNSTPSLTLEGTLLLDGPLPLEIDTQRISISPNSSIFFQINNSSEPLWFNPSTSPYISITGEDTIVFSNSLHLNPAENPQESDYFLLFEASRNNAYVLNFSNLSPEGILATEHGSFQITTTWDGNKLQTHAHSFQAIPEPSKLYMLAICFLCILLYSRTSKGEIFRD